MSKKTWEQYIDIEPISHKQPELSRNGGVYYRKSPYKTFRDTMMRLCPTLVPKSWRRFRGAIKVDLIVVKPKPKTTKRKWPIGDVDNYSKGILDRLNKIVWDDDDQILDLRVRKRWATPRKPVGIYLKVTSL